MKTKILLLVQALLLTSLLSACTLPVVTMSGISIEVVNPPAGAIYSVGTRIDVAADYWGAGGPSTIGGHILPPLDVHRVAFLANGTQVANVAAGTTVERVLWGGTDTYWTTLVPGLYQIQAEALLSKGAISISTAVPTCVVGFPLPNGGADTFGYTGPCPLPAAALSSTSSSVLMSVQASPASLLYQPNPPVANCNPSHTDLSWQASVNDPGGRVALVIVDFRPAFSPFGPSDDVILNQTGSTFPERQYANSVPAGYTDFDPLTTHTGFVITWTASAYDLTGTVLAAVSGTIPVLPCTGEPPPPPAPPAPSPTATAIAQSPTSFSTASPTPTFTPASASDCPPGTYFADVTHLCIAVATYTPTKVCQLSAAICLKKFGKKVFNANNCSCS